MTKAKARTKPKKRAKDKVIWHFGPDLIREFFPVIRRRFFLGILGGFWVFCVFYVF